MGIEPPFLYDHPSKYSFSGPTDRGFNPKSVSQASWSAPKQRPKPDGALINVKEFNRHPDSYIAAPYGNLNCKPMSPRTKSKVKWTRVSQLLLRICELLGAVGMLFCVICIKGTDATTGWIIRIPPGVAILHTVYAIYHLARSSKGRTPASSASYMLFAAVLDVSLIPFLTFTAFMARTEYIEPDIVPGNWTALFGGSEATASIIYATFLTSVVTGSLHLVSLVISIYLGVIFRKISRLPPDYNPLEDNLTSRHKRNKSSFLDNRLSDATIANANSKQERESVASDPLIPPTRTVPFMNTRNDSTAHNIVHPNPSARVSRADLTIPFYDQPPAHRSSRSEIQGPFYDQPISRRSSRTNIHNNEQPSSHYDSCTIVPNHPLYMPAANENMQATINRSPTKSPSVCSSSTMTTLAKSRPPSTRPQSTVPSVIDSNWITHPSTSPSPSPSPFPPPELTYLRNQSSSYLPEAQTSPFEYTSNNDGNFPPRPLEMNPPTPPLDQRKRRGGMEQRALTPGTGNGRWDLGMGKAKAWGGMGRSGGGGGGGGRVISRSGVEVKENGILSRGGVRAREVSGKVVEEGRGVPWM